MGAKYGLKQANASHVYKYRHDMRGISMRSVAFGQFWLVRVAFLLIVFIVSRFVRVEFEKSGIWHHIVELIL